MGHLDITLSSPRQPIPSPAVAALRIHTPAAGIAGTAAEGPAPADIDRGRRNVAVIEGTRDNVRGEIHGVGWLGGVHDPAVMEGTQDHERGGGEALVVHAMRGLSE